MKAIIKLLTWSAVILFLFSASNLQAHEGHKKKANSDTTVIAKKDSIVTPAHQAAAGVAQTPPLETFPNLHPLVVHFPIVLLIVAAIMQLIGLFVPGKSYHISIAVIAGLGAIGAYLASSLFHAHPGELSGEVAVLFEEHEQWAFWSVRLGAVGAVLKGVSLFLRGKRWLEYALTLFLIASAICVSVSGHHGAELVHKFGIGAKGYMLEKHHH